LSANPPPQEARAASRERTDAVLELLRREPQLDRQRLLSCVVARGEQIPRRSQRARVEAEPAT
jgi:hypothetical protein